MIRVGVLALQGDFAKHKQMLSTLGAYVIEVRKKTDLSLCQGLVLPGGESTVMLKQIEFFSLRQAIADFAKTKPLFGTCAGLILMSQAILTLNKCKSGNSSPAQASKLQYSDKVPGYEQHSLPFALLDIEVERNAFGRQVDSFQADLQLCSVCFQTGVFPAFFIRAPRIRRWAEQVQVLASLDEEPVLIEQGLHLAASFHPELTSDPRIHLHFLRKIQNTI